MINRRTFLQIVTKATWVLTAAVGTPAGLFFFTKNEVIGKQKSYLDVQRFVGQWQEFQYADMTQEQELEDESIKAAAMAFRRMIEEAGSAEIRNVKYCCSKDKQGYLHVWTADIKKGIYHYDSPK